MKKTKKRKNPDSAREAYNEMPEHSDWESFSEGVEKVLSEKWDEIKVIQDEYTKSKNKEESIRRLNKILSKTGFVERYWAFIENISKRRNAEDNEWKEDRAELALEEMYTALLRFNPEKHGFRGFFGYAYKSFIHTLKISERSYFEMPRGEKDKAKIQEKMGKVYELSLQETVLRPHRKQLEESNEQTFDFYPAYVMYGEKDFNKAAQAIKKLLDNQKNVVWKVLGEMRIGKALTGQLPSTLSEVKQALKEETGDDKWMRKGMEFNIRLHELQLLEKLGPLMRQE